MIRKTMLKIKNVARYAVPIYTGVIIFLAAREIMKEFGAENL